MPSLSKSLFLSIVLAGGSLAPGAASAQPQLNLVIGYSPGAIYDAYGRIVARHLGKHLPGNQTVVVQNMPGAGSLRAANYLYVVAPKDGSTIGLFARGMAMQPLLDPQGVQFDAQKFNWLGSTSDEVSVVLASSAGPFKTIEDARSREMVVSASGSGSDTAIFPYILNGVIGTKFKVVTGYPGNAEMLTAMPAPPGPPWSRSKRIGCATRKSTCCCRWRAGSIPILPMCRWRSTWRSARRTGWCST